MKIKHKSIFFTLLLVVFLTACGESTKRVATGQYYNPNQAAEDDTSAVEITEGTETKAAESTAAPETVEELGLDQFMIISNDMSEERLVLRQLASGKEYVYNYTLSTRFLDKYGDRTTVSNFEPGRVISVREKDYQGKVMEVQISDQVWEYPDVSRFSIDEERGIFQIAKERYSYDENLFVQEDGDVKNLSDLTDLDTLRVVGVGKELISVAVTTGHGELVLKNTELFEGSFIQIGEKIFAEITPDMTLEVPEGTYTVTVANNGYGGSTDVTIESGKKKKLDLDKLKGEGPKIGNILFAVDVEGAILQIDGTVMDYSEPIPLQYGVHTLNVTATNYDTFSKKLFVNSEEATIVIGLSGDGDTDSGEETASAEEDSTAAESEEAADSTTADSTTAGSLSGSLAGSLAGTLAGSEASGTTTSSAASADASAAAAVTGTDTSTDSTDSLTGSTSSTSSTDYLSTLSELLNMLTGDSD